MYLFIDTSHQSTIGLLNKSYEWVELIHSERKASFLQSEIAALLNKHNLEFSTISKVFYSAGPGSYTGMRITEGFVGTLEIINIESHGFYLFEVMNKLGLADACWISSAFKGEYFFAKEEKTFLLNEEEAIKMARLNKENLYSFNGDDILDLPTISTMLLLRQNPGIFKEIKGKQKPYYYRPLDKEFSVKQK